MPLKVFWRVIQNKNLFILWNSLNYMDEYIPDSDRLPVRTGTFEGLRGEILTCRTCYLFPSCSSNNPNKRAEDCYVQRGMLEAVSLEARG